MSWLYQPLLAAAQQQSGGEPQNLTLTADAASFTITAQDAGLFVNRVLNAEALIIVIIARPATLIGPDGPDLQSRSSGGSGAGISIGLSIGI